MSNIKKIVLGCLAIPLLVVFVGVLVVVGVFVTPAPEVQESKRALEERLVDLPPAAQEIERTLDQELNRSELALADPSTPAQRIVLKLGYGEFSVRAGGRDGALRVDGDFDEAGYELGLKQIGPDHVEVEFSSKLGFFKQLARARANIHPTNHVEVLLPRNVPIDLEIESSKGTSRVNLTGLHVRSLKLDASLGEHSIRFSEPNPVPVERIELVTRMGDFEFIGLGHARPRELMLDGRMGDHVLGFAGLSEGSDLLAKVKLRMGSLRVLAAEGVPVRIGERRLSMGEIKERGSEASGELATQPHGVVLNLDLSMGDVVIE